MNKKQNSYREILNSSFIIGGASFVNVGINLVRIKVVALLLGPAGVGLIGLLQSLMATASTIFALGFGTAGVRQVAEAGSKEDIDALLVVKRALLWGALILAIMGAIVFWLLRNVMATQVLNDPSNAKTIGMLGIGVAFTVMAGAQSAYLNGLRQLSYLAWISIGSALASTIFGVAALLLWGEKGIISLILAGPIASFFFGYWFLTKIKCTNESATPLHQLIIQWGALLRLGAAFTFSALALNAGQLLVRTLVQRELGTVALGMFQSAWVISMTYIGFVLTAMGTDYYPRLTAVIHDHKVANQLVNEQTEVALLLAAPVFLMILGVAPWVIALLYSEEFVGAIGILQWQVLGDIFKVVSWPMGFIILAVGDGRTYMMIESIAIGIYVFMVWVGLPLVGLKATGIGFVVMYLTYLPLIYWYAYKQTKFIPDMNIILNLSIVIIVSLVIFIIGNWSETIAAMLGIFSGAAHGLYSFNRLRRCSTFRN